MKFTLLQPTHIECLWHLLGRKDFTDGLVALSGCFYYSPLTGRSWGVSLFTAAYSAGRCLSTASSSGSLFQASPWTRSNPPALCSLGTTSLHQTAGVLVYIHFVMMRWKPASLIRPQGGSHLSRSPRHPAAGTSACNQDMPLFLAVCSPIEATALRLPPCTVLHCTWFQSTAIAFIIL